MPHPLSFAHYRDTPADRLALQLAGRTDIDVPLILRQVEGWQRLRHKVPRWADTEGVLFPPRLALEQCSGQEAAAYKGQLAARLCGAQAAAMADVTGGMGVDFSFMAPVFGRATYVERQEELCTLARHNFPLLGVPHAQVVQAACEDFVPHMQPVDLIYLDPARRSTTGRKTVLLDDCTPNLTLLLPLLLAKARWVVAKLSPMLDVASALRTLHAVHEVHMVGADGECKELLLVAGHDAPPEARRVVYNEGRTLSFTPADEATAAPLYASRPLRYLLEPCAALLKAGAFRFTAVHYGLHKLHQQAHLYTADHLPAHFMGRTFSVVGCYGFSKPELRRLKHEVPQANLSVRGFPGSAEALRRRLKLRDGGDTYLFATTLADGSHALLACVKTQAKA